MNFDTNKIKSISFWIPAGIFILSIVYISESFDLNFGTLSLPEEGMLPVFIGFILLFGSSFLMVQAAFKPKDNIPVYTENEITRVIFFAGVLFGYVIILPFLGFSLSTFFLILGTMKLMEVKLKTSIVTGLIVVAVSYYLFRILLNVPLPSFAF